MKIMISAGEVSGDIHGAYLVRELKKIRPDIYFYGMGSERLASEGVDIKFDISRLGTIGIFEALPNIFPIYLTFLKMKKLLLETKPDLVILIDSQGFNMPFAKFCKKVGIKTVYYIAPQEWLWGTKRGVRKVAETIDLIVAIFEKEYEIYKDAGANVIYFGHPLVDIVQTPQTKENVRKIFLGEDLNKTSFVISLCPGSRIQEIRSLLPILLKAGELIQREIPNVHFLLPVASTKMIKDIFDLIGDFRPEAIVGQTYEVLKSSDLAICTSGTINLEASILNIPNIMIYKLSPLTYLVGKYILKIGEKLKYFSMPNLLLEEKVVPELIMNEATPRKIAEEALHLLKNKETREKMLNRFSVLKSKLGSSGVIKKIAEKIIDQLKE